MRVFIYHIWSYVRVNWSLAHIRRLLPVTQFAAFTINPLNSHVGETEIPAPCARPTVIAMRDRHNSNPTNQPPRPLTAIMFSGRHERMVERAQSRFMNGISHRNTFFKNLFRWTHETARDSPDAQTTAPLPRAADRLRHGARDTGARPHRLLMGGTRDARARLQQTDRKKNVIYIKRATYFHVCPKHYTSDR